MVYLFQKTSFVSDFFARCEPNVYGGLISCCFPCNMHEMVQICTVQICTVSQGCKFARTDICGFVHTSAYAYFCGTLTPEL